MKLKVRHKETSKHSGMTRHRNNTHLSEEDSKIEAEHIVREVTEHQHATTVWGARAHSEILHETPYHLWVLPKLRTQGERVHKTTSKI